MKSIKATRRIPRLIAVATVVSAILTSATVARAKPSDDPLADLPYQPSPTVQVEPKGLDAATKRVLKLEDAIQDIRAEQIALDQRLELMSRRIYMQSTEAERAQGRLDDAQVAYMDRMVQIYKAGIINPIELLLTSEDMADLMARGMLLSRLSSTDRNLFESARMSAADAAFQTQVLEDLRAQDVQLRTIKEQRLAELTASLTKQKAEVKRLNAQQKRWLLEKRKLTRSDRERWKAGSIPLGAKIPQAKAKVLPYDEPFLVASYQPRKYQATGKKSRAVCSWYGPGFNGRNTASGQVFNEEDLTCASRTLPFGTRLALTRGNRRIVVVVNDRGPFIAHRDLDLSKAGARALGFSGVEPVQAEVVVPVR